MKFSHGLVVPSLLAAGLAAYAGIPKPPAVVDDPILEVHTSSLTTLLIASATNINDTRPRIGQRGANLDGMMRARSSHRMVLGGNPYERIWRPVNVDNVQLSTGTYQVDEIDIALPAVMPWPIGRSYNARQEVSSSHHDSDGPQGKNWFQTSQPEIQLYDDATTAADDLVYLFFGADRFVEYQRTDASSDTFRSRNGSAGIWEYSAGSGGEPDLYTLTDQHGTEITFFGFDANASPAEGQIWKLVDAGGNTAYVGDSSTASTAISNGYTSSGRIEKAYDSADRRYSYTYDGTTDRLTEVKAETKTGGTWASPTGLSEVAKVEYDYYGAETYGDAGDLKLVERTVPLTDSGVSSTYKQYYRYWEGTFNASTNPGYPHAIKYVFDSEGLRQYDWDGDSTFDEDFLTASNETIEGYATAYLEYDSSHRVNEAYFNGECGCSGGANGTYVFEYEVDGSFSDDTGAYDEEWKTRTIVHQPDGGYVTQYFDEVHQPLDRVVTDEDPDTATNRWVTHVTRDANGQVSQISTPANVTGYTHSTGAVTTSTSAGLVRTYTRTGSGARRGFVTEVKWKEGTSGTAYYEREFAYTSGSIAVGADSNLIRPFQSTVHGYSEYKSTSTSDRVTTSITETLYSGDVVPEKIVITYPTVTTAENGSNSATTKEQYFDQDGSRTWEKAEDGIITYWEYTDGRLTKMIRDADTSKTGAGQDFENVTIPSGLSSSGSPVHRVETYAYDPQGRRTTTTEADGHVHFAYFSKLADGRVVSLSYADYDSGTPKFYGPVRYTVSNHAGKSEVSATVALTSNESTTALTGHVDETDSDPITAMDLGTVVRLTTSVYGKTGSSQSESRLYFDIPVSGAGTEGTNYDASFIGYDDMGQTTRNKAAHGTISRTVYDIHGRTTERWIGTNDSSFDGGEPSGTDNMVKVEALEYDSGGDDGNGYLTKRTLYVQDSATGKRETSYTHDPLGNVLLETRPTVPHAFHEVDARGRTIATGLYSSTASIVVGTDDPASETTSRLALLQTYYDDKGQVWKTTRHEIDASDGSDDDDLESLTWYDATGRRIKADGSQLTKTYYDRLGRQTHNFILAVAENSGGSVESTYAEADDVDYDIVLEEHQTVYESSDSDDVLMRVSIARYHDDFGGSETTGELDSNADSDDLKLTAANVTGRPQITAFWYDDFGRVTDTVRYGTYGGSDFDRDGLSVPARSDTALLSENTYDTDGTVQDVTAPKGYVTRTEYDDAGRTTATIRNYVNGTPSSSTGDDDVYTRYAYTDGLRTKIWVDFDGDDVEDSDDQVTEYTYGTTKGVSAGDSKIATGHLLQETEYPDSASADDVVSLAYNAQSQELWKEDQAGNVMESEYDDSGRREKLKVTTLAGGFDGAVRRIEWAYTDLGQVETVTSYDAATSGSAVNEVEYTYDGWGNITDFKQDKDGTVGVSGSYDIAYTWAKATGGRNALKKTGVTLPSGASLTYRYLGAGGLHDAEISRLTQILHGATTVVQYKYNGLGQVVLTDYPQPDIMWDLAGTTSGSYPDLDRFNRVTSSRWTSDLATDVDFFDLDITYDRNSNITLVEDNVHVGFDWSYTMDGLDRLSRAERGTWSSGISSQQEDQTWTLDQVGNWDHVTLDFDADNDYTGTDEYDDDRTHNTVNELTGRDTDDSGTDDFTLVYDAVGNLTDDGEDYEYVYDPFGRLRKVNDQSSNLVAEYKYNGLGHMIAVHEDTDTDGDVDSSDKWFYPVHDERWRMVANFREDDSDPKEEWVNQEAGLDGRGGSSYINGVVLRDKDENTAWTSASDGTLEERIYLCQSWRGDVSALVDSNGDQIEQVRYSPYGTPFGLPGGDCDSDEDCDNGDTVDSDQIQTWIDSPAYDVRGDVDLDGDVDAVDKAAVVSSYGGAATGLGQASNNGNKRAFAGHSGSVVGFSIGRHRILDHRVGRWIGRDILDYVDGPSLHAYATSNPVTLNDWMGLSVSSATVETLPGCRNMKPVVVVTASPPGPWGFKVNSDKRTDGVCPPGFPWPCKYGISLQIAKDGDATQNCPPDPGDPDGEAWCKLWHGPNMTPTPATPPEVTWSSGGEDDGVQTPKTGQSKGWVQGDNTSEEKPGVEVNCGSQKKFTVTATSATSLGTAQVPGIGSVALPSVKISASIWLYCFPCYATGAAASYQEALGGAGGF